MGAPSSDTLRPAGTVRPESPILQDLEAGVNGGGDEFGPGWESVNILCPIRAHALTLVRISRGSFGGNRHGPIIEGDVHHGMFSEFNFRAARDHGGIQGPGEAVVREIRRLLDANSATRSNPPDRSRCRLQVCAHRRSVCARRRLRRERESGRYHGHGPQSPARARSR